MNLFGTNYDKFIVAALTIVTAVGPQILAQSGSLGLTPTIANWISIIVGAAGAALTFLSQNKNQPTLTPGTAVVNQADVKPGAPIIAAHKP